MAHRHGGIAFRWSSSFVEYGVASATELIAEDILAMSSRRRLIRSCRDIALIEESIYVLMPPLVIERAYLVTSKRRQSGAYFNSLDAATKEFNNEILRSEGTPSINI